LSSAGKLCRHDVSIGASRLDDEIGKTVIALGPDHDVDHGSAGDDFVALGLSHTTCNRNQGVEAFSLAPLFFDPHSTEL
jgi:hypothetical protein